jgi:hypothetical protein
MANTSKLSAHWITQRQRQHHRGKAVTKKANEGGGWLTWVFSTKDISPIEAKFGRPATEGQRKRPDGTELSWKQLGVIEIARPTRTSILHSMAIK